MRSTTNVHNNLYYKIPTALEIHEKKLKYGLTKPCLWETVPITCQLLDSREDGFKFTYGAGESVMWRDTNKLDRICNRTAKDPSRPKGKKRKEKGRLMTVEGRAKEILEIESKLGIKGEQWYEEMPDKVFGKYCPGIMGKGKGSAIKVLIEAYKIIDPSIQWKIYKFFKASDGFWDSIENCSDWFIDLEAHAGCHSLIDWREFSENNNLSATINNFYGATILGGVRRNANSLRFDNNPRKLIEYFCEHLRGETCDYFDWPNRKVPEGFYDDINNQDLVMKGIEAAEKFTSPADWLSAPLHTLAQKYNCTHLFFQTYPRAYLCVNAYFERRGLRVPYPWEYKQMPHGLWTDQDIRKQFVLWILKNFADGKWEKMYTLRYKDIIQKHARGYAYYHRSIMEGIIEDVKLLDPTINLDRKQFLYVATGTYDNPETCREIISEVMEENGINFENMHLLSKLMFERAGYGAIFSPQSQQVYRSLYETLCFAFGESLLKEHGISEDLFYKVNRTEKLLFAAVKELFGVIEGVQIFYNEWEKHGIINPDTGKELQLDVFIIYPCGVKLAIEQDGRYWHSSIGAKKRDKLKDEYCVENNIVLKRIGASGASDKYDILGKSTEYIKNLLKEMFGNYLK